VSLTMTARGGESEVKNSSEISPKSTTTAPAQTGHIRNGTARIAVRIAVRRSCADIAASRSLDPRPVNVYEGTRAQ
jgi:hypothetical protein